jgi:lysophospholipase L1-like esterase
MKTKLADNDTLLFTGDSITDCGRAYPVGRDDKLGDGYVSIVAARLKENNLTILNTGISGNRVPDLDGRWQKDVLNHKPDWLSVLIGINDVWRQFDSPLAMEQVAIAEYESTYRKLLEQTRPTIKGLILMSPYLIELDASDPFRAQMDTYGAVVKQLAIDFDAIFVDLQAAFNKFLTNNPDISLAADRVHPNETGHTIIADSFLADIKE